MRIKHTLLKTGTLTFALLILFHINTLCAFEKPQPMLKAAVPDLTLEKAPQAAPLAPHAIEKNDTAPAREETQAAIEKAQRESITMSYSEELFIHTAQPNNTEQEFLNDLVTFIEKTVPQPHMVPDETIYEGPKTYAYIFPRIRYIKYKWNQFFEWFKVKDKNYSSNSEREQLRKEWETLLGIDIFHPYYKYKEARKAFKKKCTFDTTDIIPGMPKMDFTPEIKDKKLYVTFSRKF